VILLWSYSFHVIRICVGSTSNWNRNDNHDLTAEALISSHLISHSYHLSRLWCMRSVGDLWICWAVCLLMCEASSRVAWVGEWQQCFKLHHCNHATRIRIRIRGTSRWLSLSECLIRVKAVNSNLGNDLCPELLQIMPLSPLSRMTASNSNWFANIKNLCKSLS